VVDQDVGPIGPESEVKFRCPLTLLLWFPVARVMVCWKSVPVRGRLIGIYPLIYCIYFTSISTCLHICLILFGYYLILSGSQYLHSLSHYYWNPPAIDSLAALLSLYRLFTFLRVHISSCLQVALTVPLMEWGGCAVEGPFFIIKI
jgi:hypothetical protein